MTIARVSNSQYLNNDFLILSRSLIDMSTNWSFEYAVSAAPPSDIVSRPEMKCSNSSLPKWLKIGGNNL